MCGEGGGRGGMNMSKGVEWVGGGSVCMPKGMCVCKCLRGHICMCV